MTLRPRSASPAARRSIAAPTASAASRRAKPSRPARPAARAGLIDGTLLANPEIDFTQGGASPLEIALLPGIVVVQPLPPVAGALLLPAEAPAILVVDRHDV